MADQKTGQENSSLPYEQPPPRSFPVLRASAFKTSEDAAPTCTATTGNKSSNSFLLRPSPLQHQALLLKEPTQLPASIPSAFKLDPPKLFSPLSSGLFCSDLNKSDEDNKTDNKTTGESTQITLSNGSTKAAKSKFVFGEKLTERAVVQNHNGPAKEEGQKAVFGNELAKRVVGSNVESDDDDIPDEIKTPDKCTENSTILSLAESAALQQAKDVKPELKEVEIITGEENESNVLKFNAKLYVFDKLTQNWHERGSGMLRLNDMAIQDNKVFQSRLVMRAQGSLRVILNIMLWSGMLIEKASPKSVKISAIDPVEGIKIYLIIANPADAELVYNAIRHRMQQLKSSEARRDESTSKKRLGDSESNSGVVKKLRLDTTGDESNDSSSAPYPETEASNEGFTSSSPAVQSSPSSDA